MPRKKKIKSLELPVETIKNPVETHPIGVIEDEAIHEKDSIELAMQYTGSNTMEIKEFAEAFHICCTYGSMPLELMINPTIPQKITINIGQWLIKDDTGLRVVNR